VGVEDVGEDERACLAVEADLGRLHGREVVGARDGFPRRPEGLAEQGVPWPDQRQQVVRPTAIAAVDEAGAPSVPGSRTRGTRSSFRVATCRLNDEGVISRTSATELRGPRDHRGSPPRR
jgi:hypothetical protein